MWLRPGPEGAAKITAPLGAPLSGLGLGAALPMVAGAAFGLIAMAGFMVIRQQLDRITTSLGVIKAGHDRLQDGVSELLDDAFDRSRHAVETALETIDMEEQRRAFASASTAFLVGASTQSSRRRTAKGRMTRPYSDGL